jgi:hypothetical protein
MPELMRYDATFRLDIGVNFFPGNPVSSSVHL